MATETAATSFIVRSLAQSDQKKWNEYVDQHAEGSFFHLVEWASLIKTIFSHQPHYLLAVSTDAEQNDERIVGLLPLVQMKSKLFGHSLVSTPFCVYGGAIADSNDIRQALENKALSLGQELGVDFVELRYKNAVTNPNYERFCHHSTFICDIAEDRDAILAGIKKKQRANVRQSLQKGLNFVINNDTKTAYDIYSESVRNLGTPVFHPKFFPALSQYFGDKVNVLTVEHAGKPVSSVLSFYYKGQVLPYYGGGVNEARGLKSNDLMYYELMCYAREQGCTSFDFGRSKDDSGAYKYKATWGISAEPLHYMRALVNATEHPNLSPNNPKYALVINVWKKLPLWVSRLVGPHLSKYLG